MKELLENVELIANQVSQANREIEVMSTQINELSHAIKRFESWDAIQHEDYPKIAIEPNCEPMQVNKAAATAMFKTLRSEYTSQQSNLAHQIFKCWNDMCSSVTGVPNQTKTETTVPLDAMGESYEGEEEKEAAERTKGCPIIIDTPAIDAVRRDAKEGDTMIIQDKRVKVVRDMGACSCEGCPFFRGGQGCSFGSSAPCGIGIYRSRDYSIKFKPVRKSNPLDN